MRFGKLVMLERVRREVGRCVARFQCDCGLVVERRIDLVRSSMARGSEPMCDVCVAMLRAGKRGIPRPATAFCNRCAGLPHRRPKLGKCVCGESYEAEELQPIWVLVQHRRTA